MPRHDITGIKIDSDGVISIKTGEGIIINRRGELATSASTKKPADDDNPFRDMTIENGFTIEQQTVYVQGNLVIATLKITVNNEFAANTAETKIAAINSGAYNINTCYGTVQAFKLGGSTLKSFDGYTNIVNDDLMLASGDTTLTPGTEIIAQYITTYKYLLSR